VITIGLKLCDAWAGMKTHLHNTYYAVPIVFNCDFHG